MTAIEKMRNNEDKTAAWICRVSGDAQFTDEFRQAEQADHGGCHQYEQANCVRLQAR